MSGQKRRVLPPIWLLLALLASWALDRWLPIRELLVAPWNYLGLLLLLAGLVMTASSARAFKKAGTAVVPFEQSTALVLDGWYRVTRNPMYLGLALILAGVGLFLGSLGALLPLPVFIAILHFRFIVGEEQFLDGIFGEPYREYRTRVRRWI